MPPTMLSLQTLFLLVALAMALMGAASGESLRAAGGANRELAGKTMVPAAQLTALCTFYKDMGGAGWKYKTSNKWSCSGAGQPNAGEDVCKWEGVTCSDPVANNIIGLQLVSMQLTGQIKLTTLSSFSALVGFVVTDNLISGTVPDLTSLSSLLYVGLDQNKLTGPLPTKFPSGILLLGLSANNFDKVAVLTALLSYTKLTSLTISSLGLTGTLPDFFSVMPGLSVFAAANNKLTGNPLTTISKASSKLTYLDLSGNAFAGSFPADTSALGKMTGMATLKLNSNSFTGSLPKEIGSWSSLVALSVNDNLFSGDLSIVLANKAKLKQLYLQRNRPTDKDNACMSVLAIVTQNFIQSYVKTPATATPEKTNCVVNGKPAGFTGGLPSDMAAQMPALVQLDVSVNSFNQELPKDLPTLAVKLDALNFNDNRFRGFLPSFASTDKVFLNGNLNTTNFANNYLQGVNLDFSQFPALNVLYLDNNLISGKFPVISDKASSTLGAIKVSNIPGTTTCIKDSFPAVTTYTMLAVLEMYNHCLQGSVPSNVEALTKLASLRLDSNAFTGTLPASLNSLTAMETLGLQFNKFSGLLPDIGKMARLKDLFISNNPGLGGSLPDLSPLSELTAFDTSRCAFTGDLPKNLFGGMKQLTYVNLALSKATGAKSTTGFTGMIPLDTLVKNNPNLATIDFSNNQFSSVEPVKSSSKALKSLVLASNLLTDDLAHIIGGSGSSFPNLEYFDVNANSIQGNLPQSFATSSLNYVDVSGNSISQISSSLFSASSLVTLMIDTNPLLIVSGTMPKLSQKLTTLRLGGTSITLSIDSSFTNLQTLYANKLKSPVSIDSSLWTSKNLQVLMLDGTTLAKQPSIPASLSMPNLQELHMSGTGLTWIIPSGWYCDKASKLLTLDLSQNSLKGDFPTFMLSQASCSNALVNVNLGQNAFTAGVALGSKDVLKNTMVALDISNSQRNGDLSQFQIAQQNLMQSFKVAGNSFSGDLLPNAWSNIGQNSGASNSLVSLDLSDLPSAKITLPCPSGLISHATPQGSGAPYLQIDVTGTRGCYNSCWLSSGKALVQGVKADATFTLCGSSAASTPTPIPASAPTASFVMTSVITLKGVSMSDFNKGTKDSDALKTAIVGVLTTLTSAFVMTSSNVQIAPAVTVPSVIAYSARALQSASSCQVTATITTPQSGSSTVLFKDYSSALQTFLTQKIQAQSAFGSAVTATVVSTLVSPSTGPSPSPPPPPPPSPGTATSNSSGAASSSGGGSGPIIGGAAGGVLLVAAIFAYWYFYMRKPPVTASPDSIPGSPGRNMRSATMDNPMMTPTNRDSIPLFVSPHGLGVQPNYADPKRASTWDAPSHAHADESSNYNQTNRLSTTQAVHQSINAGALYSNQRAVGQGSAQGGNVNHDDL